MSLPSSPSVPPWFDLGKYSSCEKLGTVEWRHQIEVRHLLFSAISRSGWREWPLGPEVELALELIRDRPLVDDDLRALLIDLVTARSLLGQYVRFDIDLSAQSVRGMSWADLFRLEDSLRPSRRKTARRRWHLLRSFQEEATAGELILTNVDDQQDDQLVHLVVNLRHDDQDLERTFTELIAKRRGKAPATREPVYAPNFSEWERTRLLPCMDLLLWKIERGARITNAELTEALFPAREAMLAKERGKNEENVKKTLVPRAKRALLGDFAAVLNSMARRKGR